MGRIVDEALREFYAAGREKSRIDSINGDYRDDGASDSFSIAVPDTRSPSTDASVHQRPQPIGYRF